MSKLLLINLPVNDSQKSKDFFERLGFALNDKLTDANAVCFNIDNNIVIALLQVDHFKSAINNNEVADAIKSNEVLLSIGMDSKEEVDTLLIKAILAGGKELHEPRNLGWIYTRSFSDLDGHQWNIFYMNQTK